MEFEWHHKKAEVNAKKHNVSFDEAVSCFYDAAQIVFYDPEHSKDEDREIMIALSESNRLLLVCYTIRNDLIRLISARLATKREVKQYEAGI